MSVDSGQRVIIAYGEGDFTDKAQFILANNYPDQNLSEEGLHWQWQTDLILGDDAALLQLFENDIKRDELRYGSDFGKLAENDSTQDSVYVLKREGYEKGQNTSDYPEYAKQAKDWAQQGDIALIKGDYVLRELHLKRYELKDHLGNVRVIVADVKDATLGLQGQPREFAAILKHYSHYYPFGMEKPAMVYDKGGYRYGFNGKENDDELKGVGNHQDYGMRVYDPRIAKFLSVDPLTKEYPMLTPYQFASNTPIQAIDLDGGEALYRTSYQDIMGKLQITRTESNYGADRTVKLTYAHPRKTITTFLSNTGLSDTDPTFLKVLTTPIEKMYAFSHIAKLAGRGSNDISTFHRIGMAIRGHSDQPDDVLQHNFGVDKGGMGDRTFYSSYENTYLHISGQALATMLYGEPLAKEIGDIHERNKRELRNYLFRGDIPITSQTEASLEDSYRDLINNEIGRQLGTQLNHKYQHRHGEEWTDKLTTNVLNDIQDYFKTNFGTNFTPFKESDDVVKATTKALNNK